VNLTWFELKMYITRSGHACNYTANTVHWTWKCICIVLEWSLWYAKSCMNKFRPQGICHLNPCGTLIKCCNWKHFKHAFKDLRMEMIEIDLLHISDIILKLYVCIRVISLLRKSCNQCKIQGKIISIICKTC
jgi:hypothetical protein